MTINIVLFEPEIPFNTGNIARTCLATNARLHLIHPLGFSLDSKHLKRAGLDYWEEVDVREYDSIKSFYAENKSDVYYYVENFGKKSYTDFEYTEDKPYYFIFGKETTGIPRELVDLNHCLKIPTTDKVRSLNLSNSVTIILFEVLRQRAFNF